MWRLFVSSFCGGKDDDTVSAVRGDLHDFGCDIRACGVVDKLLGAEREAQFAFCVTAVDGDDAHSHVFGVLDAEVAEA
jgi:hypothetical protein